MNTPETTIDHGTLRRLLGAGVQVGAEVVGHGARWGVVIRHGRIRQTLASTRGGPRVFRQFETLAGYLKDLGIVEYRVDARAFDLSAASNAAPDRRSMAASQRMKSAHEAAVHDAWFREQVRFAMDDPRSNLDADQAANRMAAFRQGLLAKAPAAGLGKGKAES
jgi:hypothetical protein